MSKREPNWTIFYTRLRKTGPKMLKNVPEEIQFLIEHYSNDTDLFWSSGIEETLNTFWSWSEDYDAEDERNAVIEALKLWVVRVKYEIDCMPDDFLSDSPEKISLLRKQAKLIELYLYEKYIDYLLEGARMPQDILEEEKILIDEPEMPVKYLDFELLPKELSDISGIITQIKRILSKDTLGNQEQIIDETRMEKIKSLNPEKCYIGSVKWGGYILFDFPSKRKAILEFPVKGNATYILTGDWREMVKHSKYYIRQNFPNRYHKIIHKGNWLVRIRQCL